MNLTFANYFKVWFETYREPKVREVTKEKYLIVLDLLIGDQLGHSDTTMIQQTYGHLLESIEEEENKRLLELI